MPKDSVLDLNSTKDMTGVVTTVPIGQSPYVDHLPDICQGITPDMMRATGTEGKKKGFTGTRLVTQTCTLSGTAPGYGTPPFSVGAAIYTNNIEELLRGKNISISQTDVPLGDEVKATVYRDSDTDFSLDNPAKPEACRVAWGTFFGSGGVLFQINLDRYEADTCKEAVDAARALLPAFPTRPAQMRPSE